MSDDKIRESRKDLIEKRKGLDAAEKTPLEQYMKTLTTGQPVCEGIQFTPHRTAGLQSAADMWIDKERMMTGIHDKKLLQKIIEGRKY